MIEISDESKTIAPAPSNFPEALKSLSQGIPPASEADPGRDLRLLLSSFLKTLLDFSGAEAGVISLFSEQEDLFTPFVNLNQEEAQGTSEEQGAVSKAAPFHPGEGLAGKSAGERRAIFAGPQAEEAEAADSPVEKACFPWMPFGQIKGVLELRWKPAQMICDEKRWQVQALSDQAASLLSAAQEAAQLKTTTSQLIIYYVFASRILGAKTLPQALDLMVRFALEITPAASVVIYLWDVEKELTLGHGLERSGNLISEKAQLFGEDISRHILSARQPVVISGLEPKASELVPTFLSRTGILSYISLPLKFANHVLQGVFDLHYPEARSFTSMELEGLRLFADQASNIIEHLHLIDHNRQRQTDLDAVIDTIHILTSTLDIDELLRQISIRLTWVMDVDACSIAAYDPIRNRMNVLAHYNSLGTPERTIDNEFYELQDYPATARLLKTGDYLIVDPDDPQADPAEVAFLKRFDYKNSLVYPLIAIDQPIGVVELHSRRSEHRFTLPAFRKMRLLSEQVALALINAKIYSQEQRVRLMAENLRDAIAALNSTLELNQVLDLILMHLQKVVPMDNASLLLVEGEAFHTAAEHNQPHLRRENVTKLIREEPLIATVLEQKEPLILPDAQQDLRFKKAGGSELVRGWMGVPMMERGEVIGMLTVESRSPQRYTEEDARLALAFANQAAIAVINARLYQSARRQRMLAESMRAVSLELSGSLQSNEILGILLDRLRLIVPYDSGCAMLIDGSVAKVACQRGYERFGLAEEVSNPQLPINEIPHLLKINDTSQPLLISNVQADPNWISMKTSAHVRSWIGAPLAARERMLGFLSLDKVEPGFYKSEHVKNLETLASHVSMALLNAQIYGEVELASITDFLTGAFNHRHFHQQLRQEIERARRINYPLSLLMIDLDFFKRVNDTFGHPTGDQVLKQLAQRIKKELRGVDMLARYGGEEFTIILPGTPYEALMPVAQRLLAVISSAPFLVADVVIPLTISIGGATFPDQADDAQSLVAQADQAMYISKHSGRNCFHTVESENSR